MPRDRELYKEAKIMRRRGKSYSEIVRTLNIPKSTLSSWFSRKDWSKEIQKKQNINWKKRNAERLSEINKSRKLKTKSRHDQYRKQAQEEYESLKTNPLFLIGISIYWGEGEKSPQGRVAVINSDPGLLKVVANFFRKCLKVSEDSLRGALFIYRDQNEKELLKFWSKELKIPYSQFIKTQVLSSRSKLAKNRINRGICNLYFSNTKMHIKVLEWIKLLGEDMRE